MINISKISILIFTSFIYLTTAFLNNSDASINIRERANMYKSFLSLPIYFIQNKGQTNSKVKYIVNGLGNSMFFTEDGVYLVLNQINENREQDSKLKTLITKSDTNDQKIVTEVLRLIPVNANKNSEIIAEDILESKVNYFIGNNPEKWKTNIPTFKKVRYKELYEGIDLVFYGNQRQLEYDIIVKRGGNPSSVTFEYQGITELNIDDRGDLVATLPSGKKIIQKKPDIYQKVGDRKVKVYGTYKIIKEDDRYMFSFELSEYDKRHPLLIDPVLIYSTYLGGMYIDKSLDIAVDNLNSPYITGFTWSTNFPTHNPLQENFEGNIDVFVTKLNPSGDNIIYSTFIGGDDEDAANSIAVDPSGNAYITGYTRSPNFPTLNPLQDTLKGAADAFVLKLNPSGDNIIYSTFIGGNDEDAANSIAIDPSGNAYITGYTRSPNFPTLNPLQDTLKGYYDIFVSKLSPSGDTLAYSTFIGGSDYDSANSIAVDSSGNAYITGYTWSKNYPIYQPFQENYSGSIDAFVTKLNTIENRLIYSTFIGGNGYDSSNSIAIDSSGNAYITGYTWSDNFPTYNPIQITQNGMCDAFVLKIGKTYTLSISKTGNGDGIITSTPSGIDCGNKCTNEYSEGTTVILSAEAYPNSTFEGWGLDCSTCGNNSLCQVTVNKDINCSVNFNLYTPKRYTLTINKSGSGSGTITSNPQGIYCGDDCTETYDENTLITLTADPNIDSTFLYWSDDCSNCGANTSCQITIDADKTCSAIFSIKQYEIITLVDPPDSGSITCNPNPVNHGDRSSCTINTNVGYKLQSIEGTCEGSIINTTFTTMPITAPCTIIAIFEPIKYTLKISKKGTGGGDIISNPEGIDCGYDCEEEYEYGKEVSLTASPDDSSTFVAWSDDCSNCSTNNICQVKMDNQKNCTGVFNLKTHSEYYYKLTVIKTGTGNGIITSTPKGINCGNDCEEDYPKTTKPKIVRLKIKPDKYSTFLGWGGDCFSNGQKTTCKLKMDNNKNVVVNFGIPDIVIQPTEYDFGEVKVKEASTKEVFTIYNYGPGDLKILKTKIVGKDSKMFKISGLKKKIRRGDSCKFRVTFKPTSIGSKTAKIQIISNDPENQLIEIYLMGNGI